jgi:FixJ family two-component response regulator
MSQLEDLGRVLIVDDDPQLLAGLSRNLRRLVPVVAAAGGAEALAVLKKDRAFSVIICDMRMPGMDGAQFFAEARLLVPDAVRILLTGQADLAAVVAAINQGRIYRFIAKPVDRDELMRVIGAAMAHYRLQQEEQRQLEASRRHLIDWAQDVLCLSSVVAWGEAVRTRRASRLLAEHLGLNDVLAIEATAVLAATGKSLGPGCEPDRVRAAMKSLAGTSERMEAVHAMLDELTSPPGTPLRIATRVVQVAQAVDDAAGPFRERVDQLEASGALDVRLATALRELETKLALPEGRPVPLAELAAGARLTRPLVARDGSLLAPAGVPVSALLLARLSGAAVAEPVWVEPEADSALTPIPFSATA